MLRGYKDLHIIDIKCVNQNISQSYKRHCNVFVYSSQVTEGKDNHQLMTEYYQNNRNTPLFSDNLHSPSIPLAVHAVFAMVEALRVKHEYFCLREGLSGVCDNLVSTLVSRVVCVITL